MRVLVLFLSFVAVLLSQELDSSKLELAKQFGVSQEMISSYKKEKKDDTLKKEQIIKNDIASSKEQVFEDNKENLETKNEVARKNQDVLKRYGDSFFKNKNRVDPYSIPTPKNYILNYADSLSIQIFGAKNETFDLKINKDGFITIAQVGKIKLIGKSFQEAKKQITEKIKKAYPNSTNILVDISEFTSIQVTVSGLVQAPGLYNLSSFSTIKDALIQSGGILKSGSYRNIYVKRDGKKVKNFDLYKIVRYGNNSSDMILKAGDTIVVPSISKQITLKGEVNIPAIYELKKAETFKTLISFASNFTAKANKKAINLKRFENNSIKLLTLSKDEFYKKTPKNGDEIEVFPLSLQGANLVKFTGNVTIPLELELPKDKKLSTLLNKLLNDYGKSGVFKKDTNYAFALIENLNSSKSFNLKEVLENKIDIDLKSGDIIKIYKDDELQTKSYIYADGNIVSEKKKYDFIKGYSAKDLFSIVNFKKEKIINEKRVPAYVDNTKVLVNRVENGNKITILVNLEKNADFKLKAFDEVRFFDLDNTKLNKKASIKGEVFIPGNFYINSFETIKGLLKLAGGLTPKALYSRCELVRYETKGDERVRTVHSLDLKKAIDLNLKVLPDDEWTIFAISNWNEKKYITLEGQVKYPGVYAIEEGEKLASVVSRAGGFTKNAFLEGSVFTRDEIQKLQEKRLEESLERLKRKALSANVTATKAGEKAEDKHKMMESVNELEKKVSSTKPIGRIALNLYYDLNRFKTSSYNITLKDKDRLYIPTINDTISVVGEVLNQSTFVYDSKFTAKDYLSKSGGLTELAEDDYIYIVKANGEAIKYESSSFWGSEQEVFKGDTIVVPMKLDTISDIAFAKDVTSILYQLAVTAASLKTVGGI